MYGVALLMLEISTDFSGAATDFFRLDGIGLPLKVGSSKSGYANHAPLRALSEWVGTQIEGNQARRSGGLERPRAPASRSALERDLERLPDRGHEAELEVLAQMLGDLVDVLLVERRRDHGADTVALRGQRLLLEATDRQHLAGQGDLPRHRHVRPDEAAGE